MGMTYGSVRGPSDDLENRFQPRTAGQRRPLHRIVQMTGGSLSILLAVAVSAVIFLFVGALVDLVTHSADIGLTVWVGGTGAMSWWMIAAYRRRRTGRDTGQLWARTEHPADTPHAQRQRTDLAELRSELDEAIARHENPNTASGVRSRHIAPTAFAVDRTASRVRTAALQDYLAAHVLDRRGSFICSSARSCKTSVQRRPGTAFLEAQGHSVGPAYDLTTEGGAPFRVLVIPMEVGGANPENHHRTVEQRTQDILAAGALPFRARNPHMKGVTFALRLAFGLPVDDEAAEHLRCCFGRRRRLG